VLGVALILATLVSRQARADRASYLWDGGALPFFWGSLAAKYAFGHVASPPATPRLFGAREGGARRAAWELPNWTVIGSGAAVILAIGAGGDDVHLDHAKGLAESLATASLLSSVLKDTFGRHRPDWTATGTDREKDQSFPSGHTIEAFAIGSYAALYLHDHVFEHARSALPELAADAGILAAASAVGTERRLHNRHFVSDVVAGSILGTAVSTLFFRYQEHRARSGGEPEMSEPPSVGLGGVF
jgi:membrane-associated phospholipid phosphatase